MLGGLARTTIRVADFCTPDSGTYESLVDGVLYRLGAVAGAQLLHERAHVKLCRALADEQRARYLLLHWNGKYRIQVRIHEPGKSSEKVTFLQEVHDLPK